MHAPSMIGAGGQWTTHDEHPDPAMEVQLTPTSCFAACAAFILRSNPNAPSQRALLNRTPTPTPVAEMKAILNSEDQEFTWDMSCFGPKDSKLAATFLRRRLPCILIFKEFGNPLHHAVILQEIRRDGRWIVRDPWNTNSQGATFYAMDQEDLAHPTQGWMGFAFHRWTAPTKRRRRSAKSL